MGAYISNYFIYSLLDSFFTTDPHLCFGWHHTQPRDQWPGWALDPAELSEERWGATFSSLFCFPFHSKGPVEQENNSAKKETNTSVSLERILKNNEL